MNLNSLRFDNTTNTAIEGKSTEMNPKTYYVPNVDNFLSNRAEQENTQNNNINPLNNSMAN